MKITYFKAENFAGIFAGTGLYTIEITKEEFEKNKNNIILLLGRNGSGKSTLESILHPYRETFDNRKSIILDGKDGYKEIHLNHKNHNYIIKHFYGKSSSKNKSFIMEDDVELNENGNITSFVDILKLKFNLTKDYFTIGKMGSNIAGFIGKKTSERKSFMNEFIPDIDEYLNAYDIINEKYKNYSKEIKSLKENLKNLDQSNLLMEKTKAEMKLKELDDINKELNSKLAINNNKLNEIKEELKDIPLDIDIKYNQAKTNAAKEEVKFKQYLDKYPKLSEYTLESIQSKLSENNLNIDNLKNNKSMYNDNIEEKKSLLIKYNDDELKYTSLKADASTDFIKPSEISVKLFNIKNELNLELDKRDDIIKKLDELELYDFANEYSATLAEQELESFLSTIQTIKSLSDEDTLCNTDLTKHKEYGKEYNLYNKKNSDILNKIAEIDSNLFYLESNYNKYSKIYANKPSNCIINTCPFIKEAQAFMENEYPLKEEYEINKAKLKKQFEDNATKLEVLKDKILICRNTEDYVLSKIDSYIFMNLAIDFEHFNLLSINTRFEEDCRKCIKIINDYNINLDELERLDNSYEQNENLLKINKEKESLINQYEEKINETKNNILSIKESISEIENKIYEIDKSIKIKNNTNTLLLSFKNILTNYNNHKEEYNKLYEIYMDNKDKLETIEKLEINISDCEFKINLNNQLYNKTNDNLINITNNLFLFDTYNNKLKTIETDINDLELIKDALDPKKGIPLIFMQNYLNKISAKANKLLAATYGDKFKIDFDVNSKEFNINVYKNDGTFLQDILEGSQGEIAMTTIALSLSMMENILDDCAYNILYLDEVDATLSAENRASFLELLDTELELEKIEQCFVISHNDSYQNKFTDFILFEGNTLINNLDENGNIKLDPNCNIIHKVK